MCPQNAVFLCRDYPDRGPKSGPPLTMLHRLCPCVHHIAGTTRFADRQGGLSAAPPRARLQDVGPVRSGSLVQMLADAAAVSLRAAKDAATAIRRRAALLLSLTLHPSPALHHMASGCWGLGVPAQIGVFTVSKKASLSVAKDAGRRRRHPKECSFDGLSKPTPWTGP